MKNIVKKAMMFVLAFGAISVATEAFAGISYSDKKQGKVHFTPDADSQDDAANAPVDGAQNPAAIDPSSIEPAAGAEAPEAGAADEDMSKKMKLPRKN